MFKQLLKSTLFCLALLCGSSVFGQAGDYSFSVSTSTYVPLGSSATVVSELEADGGEDTVGIGFDFEFEGTLYDTVAATSDGFLSFVTGATSTATNDLDNGSATRRPLIAPLWDDHDGEANSSAAAYEVTGTAPNRVFTFEWRDWKWRYSYSSSDSVVSFQVKLYETTNAIEFHYRWECWSCANSPSASIGLSGASTFLSVTGLDTGSPSASNTSEDSSIDTVVTNQVFTFAPPACTTPTYSGVSAASASSLTIDWTHATAANFEVNWDIQGFTQGASGSNTSTVNTNSFTANSLSAGTAYDFYIRTDCGSGVYSNWTGPYTATTAFMPPYVENWANGYPNGWGEAQGLINNPTVFSNSSSSSWTQDGFSNNGSTGAARINIYGTSADEWLISPSIDLGSGTTNYQLEFDASLTVYAGTGSATLGSDDTVKVVISTDNGATWSNSNAVFSLSSTDAISNGAGNHYIVNLTGYTGLVKIGFYAESTSSNVDNDFFIDNVEVVEVPACAPPTAPADSNITTSSVDLGWQSPGSGPWYIYWGPCGFDQATPGVSVDTATVNSVTITGLSANTQYQFYVVEDCAAQGLSDSLDFGCIGTECGSLPIPFYENFSSGSTTEYCWTVLDNNSDGDAWDLNYTSNVMDGDQVAMIYTDYNAGNNDDWLISPALNLTGNERLRFSYRVASAGEPNNWEVLVSTTGTNPADFTDTIVDDASYSNITYQELVVNIDAFTGPVYIAWHIPSGGLDGWRAYIDSVVVEPIPACPESTDLISLGASHDTVGIAWTPGGSANTYGIEYGASGFTPGSGSFISTTDTFAVASGLSPNTLYDFYVYDTCATGYSIALGPISVRTACMPVSIPFVETFNSTSTTEDCWTVINANNDVDSWDLNYTFNPLNGDQSAVLYTDYNAGANDDWLISPTLPLTGNEQLIYYYRVQSSGEPNDFEVLISTTGTNPASFTSTLLPLASYNNTTYMKQTIDVSGYSGNANIAWHVPPAGLDGWRVYIDSVVVEPLPPCADPTVLTATNLQPYQATLGWTQPSGTSWNIEWGPQGFLQGSGVGNLVNGVGNPYVLTNLGPDTCYDYYVQQACGSAGTSAWVGPFTFCTTPTCPAPTGLGVDPASIGTTTADIFWTPAFNASHFNVEYGPLGFARGAGTAVNAANDTLSLSNLSASTCYEFYVRDSCAVGDVSTWVGPFPFGTNGGMLTLPVVEDFENGLVYLKNSCTNTIDWTTQQTIVKNGSNAGKVAYQIDDTIILELSGMVDLSTVSNPTLTFWHIAALEGGYDEGFVEISTDAGDTYTALPASAYVGAAASYPTDLLFDEDDYSIWGTATAPAQNTWWQNEVFDLSGFKQDSVRIRFRLTSDGSVSRDGWYLDDVRIENVTCPMPSNLGFVSSTIGSDSAEIYWTTGGASYANVEYGPAGYTPGTGTVMNAANDTVVINGLSASTCYDFYVRDSCGIGDVSNWNGPITFCTACLPYAAPYYEDFNANGWIPDNTGSAPNSVIGNCWERNPDNGTSYSWRVRSTATASSPTGPNQDFTGTGNFVYTEASSGGIGNVAELISPEVDLTGTTAPILTYAYHFFGVLIDTMYIDINAGSGWILGVDSIIGQQQTASSDPWLMDTVDLSAYINSTVSVRFRSISAGCCTGDMAIDEFYVGDPATCLRPTALGASAATANSVVLNWTSGGASNWNIEYGPIGFTLGTGTRVTNVNANPYTLGNLQSSTCYEYYVRDSCGATSVSLWGGPYSFTTGSAPLTFPITEDFENGFTYFDNNCENMTMWGIQQTIINGGSNAVRLNYQNYDSSMIQLTGMIDLTNTVAPVLAFSQIAALEGTYDEGHVQISTDGGATYIDLPGSSYMGSAVGYAGNLYFHEDDYTVWGTATAPAQNSWWQDEMFDLSLFKEDSVMIRFMVGSDGSIIRDGWYIDDIQIIEMPCISPDNVNVVATGCDTVDVTWTSNSASTSSYIEYGAKGFTPGSGIVVANVTSPHQITGLSLNTEYDIYVVDSCGMDQSNPSSLVTFKTDSVGPVMASFVYSQVSTTLTDADVDFDASGSTGDGLSYSWNFDGSTGSGVNAQANYTGNGTYNVTLTVTDRCGNTDDTTVVITIVGISIVENEYNAALELYPNPNQGIFKVNVSEGVGFYSLEVIDLSGKVVYLRGNLKPGEAHEVNLGNVADGVYMLRFKGEGLNATQRIVVE